MSVTLGRNVNKQFIEEFGQDLFNDLKSTLNTYTKSDDLTKNREIQLSKLGLIDRVVIISIDINDKYGFTHTGVYLINGTTLAEFESYIDNDYNEDIDIIGYSDTDIYRNISNKWKRDIKINRLLKKD